MGKRRPRYLYHASAECVRDAIYADGLKSGWEGVYAAETPEQALRFVALRAFAHMHGMKTMLLPNGDEVPVPNIVQHDVVDVWKIDTYLCKGRLWRQSYDHSPIFFGPDVRSWLYPLDIHRECLLELAQYSLPVPDLVSPA